MPLRYTARWGTLSSRVGMMRKKFAVVSQTGTAGVHRSPQNSTILGIFTFQTSAVALKLFDNRICRFGASVFGLIRRRQWLHTKTAEPATLPIPPMGCEPRFMLPIRVARTCREAGYRLRRKPLAIR